MNEYIYVHTYINVDTNAHHFPHYPNKYISIHMDKEISIHIGAESGIISFIYFIHRPSRQTYQDSGDLLLQNFKHYLLRWGGRGDLRRENFVK